MDIKYRKLRAFTLSEMIVVLLITAIVVGMAFSVLGLVQGQMDGIRKNYEKNTELDRLRQSLWIDFNSYDRAFYDRTLGELMFVSEPGSVRYRFDGQVIVKETDTFHIEGKDLVPYFENKERSFGEIDALGFGTTNEMGGRPVFVFKENAATTYMNR